MAVVKNIIFDLGGVLLDIDFNKTANAFKALGVQNFDDFYTKETANHLFESLETGDISNDSFLAEMQLHCAPGTSIENVLQAWNAILLDFRYNSIRYLQSLQSQYNIYLLSNTNSIHHAEFSSRFSNRFGGAEFNQLFRKAYYSHLLRKRKPYPETYRFVINDAGLIAEETLFIDDAAVNIEGAAKAGLHTRLLLPEERIETIGL